MHKKVVVLILLCGAISAALLAQPGAHIQKAVTDVETLVKADSPDRGELKLKRAALKAVMPDLEQAANANNATDADKEWLLRAQAAMAEADKILDPSIASLIGSTKPMTAVLFSDQSRNSFEVVKDPLSADAATGIINQSTRGSTGGILIAAEAPFAYPAVGFRGDVSRVPIGAWFGVNLKTGGGDEVGEVDLAAGLSFSFISANSLLRLQETGRPGLTGSARLLLGVVYGEVSSLGPKDTGSSLAVGDAYPMGDSLPLHKEKKISFAYGIGFRF